MSELRGSGASVKMSFKDFNSCLPLFQYELCESHASIINYRQKFEDRSTVYSYTMFNTTYMKLNIMTPVDSVIYYCVHSQVQLHQSGP
ncbi:hypothetical protein U0070_002770 [Myodes glareolus]|uniref:Uncharacterized protein n=1 Tax=Myodes glareolus TaxID=447135 RepID=A0AAW0HLS4_MYOGA